MPQGTRIERRQRRAYASLREYFDQTGARQSDAAWDLGISEAHLSNIISGRKRPSVELAVKISRLANVPIEAVANLSA